MRIVAEVLRASVALGVVVALVFCTATACSPVTTSGAGGKAAWRSTRTVKPGDIALPDGYVIEVVQAGLSFPTGITFDAEGQMVVTEAGYSYGEVFLPARLLRFGRRGAEIVTVSNNGPWNGVVFHDGAFFVAEGGHVEGGRILRIEESGEITVLVEGLPSLGDHHTNGPVVGPDDNVYFGQGTVTNSAVVGGDNARGGWLMRHPRLHDTPCTDVTLSGANYESDNPLTPEYDTVTTGAFLPLGVPSEANQVITGALPCNGAVMRVPATGGAVELVAWGFRNPYGLAFGPDASLYVTENGYDVRGSRPVFGAADPMWRVQVGRWYGWPDFSEGQPIFGDERFRPPGDVEVRAVLATHPETPPRPVAYLGAQSSSNGIDFSRSHTFGYVGQAFIAQFGALSRAKGKAHEQVGFKVVRVEPHTGVIYTFAANRKGNGPASEVGGDGFERPTAARFDPSGSALYVVDFGVVRPGADGPEPEPGTGVIWRIRHR